MGAFIDGGGISMNVTSKESSSQSGAFSIEMMAAYLLLERLHRALGNLDRGSDRDTIDIELNYMQLDFICHAIESMTITIPSRGIR